LPRIDGCEQIFFKDLDNSKCADIVLHIRRCIGTTCMQVNEEKLIHYLIKKHIIFGIPHVNYCTCSKLNILHICIHWRAEVDFCNFSQPS
jgi:hypothetical protein